MAAVLKLFLVQKFDPVSDGFGDAFKTSAGKTLVEYFTRAIGGTSFSSVELTWTGKASEVTRNDLVCYCVPTVKQSVIAASGLPFGGSLGGSGTTGALGSGVVSEVYMLALRGNDPRAGFDPKRDTLLANIVLHELMHNLLDATKPALVNVHAVPGGTIGVDTDTTPINSNMSPSVGDIGAIKKGLMRKSSIAQYTAAM